MIDQKTLKQLIKLMVDNELTELDLEGEGEKVKLKRSGGNREYPYAGAPPLAVPPPGPDPSSLDTAKPGDLKAKGDADELEGAIVIDCPMVGTFYRAPSPDAKPFVNVGDAVEPETVVCIIEAMKVLNEIKAETRGTVKKTLVTNGQAVEFGQTLFLVKPE